MVTTVAWITVGALLLGARWYLRNPQFGRPLTREQKRKYASLENFQGGRFVNPVPSMPAARWRLAGYFLKQLCSSSAHRFPRKPIPWKQIPPAAITPPFAGDTCLFWLGHSTVLVILEGKLLLLDPFFGERAWMMGRGRYTTAMPLELEDFSVVDAVVISHAHFDHLDYYTIQRLRSKVQRYYVPLGIGKQLQRWGVQQEKITELNWWEEATWESIRIVCTPALHYSARGIGEAGAMLWASWILQGRKDRIFFSGDGGYGSHFRAIGERYGPFDIALMECGQYDQHWRSSHLFPQESVRAAVDVGAKVLLPTHWGAFTLAFHAWTEPVEVMIASAEASAVAWTVPQIGEAVWIGEGSYPTSTWWRAYV